MKKERAVAYCRVSTSSKDQANSYENQVRYFNRETEKEGKYKLVEIYADKGVTGTSLNRPEFDKMLYDAGLDIIEVRNEANDERKNYKKYVTIQSSARKPKFDIILVKDISRFARNVEVEGILNDLARVNVYVKFLDINKSTKDSDNRIIIQLLQTLAEQESRDRSKKVIWGVKEGAKNGVISTSNRLYGYKYIQAENRLEIIPHEAKVIEKIFDLYIDNYGARRIINYLDSNGIKTRQGKSFGKTTIRAIIINEKYAGINARMKYDTGTVFNKKSYAHIRPKEDWIITETDKIPAIISEEKFNKAQEVLKSKVNHKNNKGVYNGKTKYSGLIICSNCGSTYYSDRDRGRRFFRCRTKKQEGVKVCNNPNISLEQLEEAITAEKYNKYVWRLKYRHLSMLNVLIKYLENKKNNTDFDRIEKTEKELEELEIKNSRLMDIYIEGTITKEEFESKKEPLNKLISDKEMLIKDLNKPVEEIDKDILEVEKTIDKIRNIERKPNYEQDELLGQADKIIVTKSRNINIKYKISKEIEDIVAKYDYYEISQLIDEGIKKGYISTDEDYENGNAIDVALDLALQ